MRSGWIKLHRSLMRHWLYGDVVMLRIWIDILLKASHTASTMLFNGTVIAVERGSFVVSKSKWAKEVRISRPRLDRILKKFESDKMIEQHTSNRRTLITVVNYQSYQTSDEPDVPTNVAVDGTTDKQLPINGRSSTEQPACTLKNDKNSKNLKKDEEVCGEAMEPHELDGHFMPIESNAEWLRSSQYLKAGRRPLKKYPDMFLTSDELEAVFKHLSDAGIPNDRFKLVFSHVAARITTYKVQGRSLEAVSVYNWLTGWAKSDVVKELTASANLERSKVYLAGVKS